MNRRGEIIDAVSVLKRERYKPSSIVIKPIDLLIFREVLSLIAIRINVISVQRQRARIIN